MKVIFFQGGTENGAEYISIYSLFLFLFCCVTSRDMFVTSSVTSCDMSVTKWSRCSFDWMITKKNALKILEGTYANKGGTDKSGNSVQGFVSRIRQYIFVRIYIYIFFILILILLRDIT